MANKTGRGTFQKGDPRINRKGRPKDFDALRALAQEIAHEKALSGGQPVVIAGHAVTVAEAILRQWAQSKNPQLQRGFIEIAYGKVPDKVEMSGPDGAALRVEHRVCAFDYDGFARAWAAQFGDDGGGDVAENGSGEPVDTAHADAEAGVVPGASGS